MNRGLGDWCGSRAGVGCSWAESLQSGGFSSCFVVVVCSLLNVKVSNGEKLPSVLVHRHILS